MNEIFDEAKPLIELFRKSVDGAVEAERERCKMVARTTVFDVCPTSVSVGDYIAEQIDRTTPKPPPPPEPMTIEKVIEKMKAGWPAWASWSDLESDLTALVQGARDKGFEEGESKQAILEVHARDKFIAECECEKCGHRLNAKPEPPPANEPMTIPEAIDALRAVCETKDWLTVVNTLQTLVQAQARRDAELMCETLIAPLGPTAAHMILESAGLE